MNKPTHAQAKKHHKQRKDGKPLQLDTPKFTMTSQPKFKGFTPKAGD